MLATVNLFALWRFLQSIKNTITFETNFGILLSNRSEQYFIVQCIIFGLLTFYRSVLHCTQLWVKILLKFFCKLFSVNQVSETFDEIWSFIENQFQTPVPPYFKFVLKYCGYENGVSIATIDNDDIKYFVEEVRNGNVINHFKSKFGDKDFLEGSTKNMDNFDFSRGHKKFLMCIVTFLKNHIEEHGIDSFSRPLNSNFGIKRPSQQSAGAPPKRLKQPNPRLDPSGKVSVPYEDLRKQEDILIKKTITSLISYVPEIYVKVSVLTKTITLRILQTKF